MEDRKLIKILVPVVLLGFFVFNVPRVEAYGVETHAYLTSEVINFYNQNYSNNQIPNELKNYLIDGSRKEDEPPRWLNHFYDPVYSRGLVTSYGIKGYNAKSWAQNANMQNEVRFKVTQLISSLLTAAEQRKISEISADANFTWNKAIEFYAQGENEKAMFALGHVLHLIEDLGVPDHTRNDDHPEGSPYEDFTKRFNLNSADSGLSSRLAGRGVVSLDNLDAHFNSLATYSNNNFYSKDTIGIQSGYNLPQPTDYEIRNGLRFARGQDEGEFYRLFVQPLESSVLISVRGEITVEKDEIMQDYWSRLSPKVVQHGAGVIDLFFQEAEKAKNEQKFIKKEKEKNFLTKIIDAAKAAVSNIFNKASNKPAAVIDTNQAKPQTAQVSAPLQKVLTNPAPPPKTKSAVVKVNPKKEEPKKEAQTNRQTEREVKECSFSTNQSPSRHEIIINEVAWMGGLSSAGLGASDEWIELKNLTNKPINISGWQVVDKDENIQVVFKEGSSISANGFYLLERTSDAAAPGVTADVIYSGALANSNEGLRLFAADCNLIDEVLASPDWPAGDNAARRTMQRGGGLNWSTYGAGPINGILGTPRAENGPVLAIEKKDTIAKTVKKTSDASTSDDLNEDTTSTDERSPVTLAEQAATGLLITEVQITGGTGKTDYDFAELFNASGAPVNLKGHRLVKRSKTGISDTTLKSWTSDTIVAANSYYLWANTNHSELGVIPDITTTGTLSNDSGVAVRFGAENTGTIIDSVGWGEAANAFVEGLVFVTNPGANESIQRKTGSGFIDTGNNANDFEVKNCLTPKAPPCTVNQPPIASLSFSPAGPKTDELVNFDASGSSDPDGSVVYYLWELGDPLSFSAAISSTSPTTTYKYSTAGGYTPRVTVFDSQNASATATVSVTLNNPATPPPSGSSPTFTVLFEQLDESALAFHPGDGGVKWFSLGQGVTGSANKLKVKFAPDIAISADGKYHLAPILIRKTGEADTNNWLYWSETTPFANQPKYCFVTTDVNVFKDITFTFASALNFLAANTYEAGMVYLKNEDAPANHDVCGSQESVGNGNAQQGNFKAGASGKIYFQVGN